MNKNKKVKLDPLIAVVERNNFYKTSYRKLIMAFIISFIINIFLGGAYYYMVTHPVKPIYFAVTVNGRLLPVYPIDVPNQSDKEVLEWAKEAAMAAFTYNYSNYRREFQASSDFFSPWGWTQFLGALKSSNNLDAIIAKKLIVSAQLGVSSSSMIKKQGIVGGHYAWRVKIPLIVTYQSTMEYSQTKTNVTLLIVRLSNLNSPSGIGIEQFVVAPG